MPEEPPYPTFKEREEQRGQPPFQHPPTSFSETFGRLIWPLRGEISAISVMKQPHQAAESEPLFNGTWHEIASRSITNKKVSSIEVSVDRLEEWDHNWQEFHMEHAEPEDGNSEWASYGDLENPTDDGSDAGSDREILARCCGEDRPLGRQGRVLEVCAAPGHFVTIKDFIGAVHPWLMSMIDDIHGALQTIERMDPNGTEWRISNFELACPGLEIWGPEIWDAENNVNQGTYGYPSARYPYPPSPSGSWDWV